MRFSLKHIFIICVAVLLLETLVLSAINANYINNNNRQRAGLVVSALLQVRASLQNQETTFIPPKNQDILLAKRADFIAVISGSAPDGAYFELPESTAPISSYDFNSLTNTLIKTSTITLATRLKGRLTDWLILRGTFQPNSPWDNAPAILLVNFFGFLIVWVCFLLYYHYTLPGDVMSLLAGDQRKRRLNDTLINNLREHLQKYVNERTIMITALAHDIKTPLTEALLRLELLDDPELIGPIQVKLENINNIVRSSLEYARQPDRIRKAKTEVVSLTESVIDQYREIDFDVIFTPYCSDFTMMVEVELFKRMLVNLIENARKYATSCEITLAQPNHSILELTCQDDGPGVPDEFLGLIAIPYFRVDQARTTDKGGSGLGLAIVKKIVELHHGVIDFSNQPGGGFTVTITFDRRRQRKLSKLEK